MTKRVVAVDFETAAIQPRPAYPPRPVGVAIGDGRRRQYLAWGHPEGNNSTIAAAAQQLDVYWRNPEVELVFHHSKFDLDVAETWLKLRPPPWQRCHDTLFLLYLDDPRAPTFALKPSAERLLRLPPEEREAVREWLVERDVVRRNDRNWGAHICHAPAKLVGAYALGDVDRTLKLFGLLLPQVAKRGMLAAYDRERRLLPMLLDNERQGVRVDLRRLSADARLYGRTLEQVDAWLRRRLRSKGLDLDSDEQLADALDAAGLVTEWVQTAKGHRSTSRRNLRLTDQAVSGALVYRGVLATCLRTFMLPWLAQATETTGVIHTNWNQVRGENKKGTTTGRMSSNPNLQNIPTAEMVAKAEAVRKLKAAFMRSLPPLPRVRGYIVGDTPKHVVGSADFCFSPDTEVLTDQGWKLFPDLDRTERVAQWRGGMVSFAEPRAWQEVDYAGPMYHIRGERSADLLVSENHRCLIESQEGSFEFVTPSAYPIGRARQHHAGVLPGGKRCDKNKLILAVAIQADARIQGNHADFYLKKLRKIDRLLTALDALQVEYARTLEITSKPGFQRISFPWAVAATWLCVESHKTFVRSALMALAPDLRCFFLEELGYWDGSIKTQGRCWYYANTNLANVELVSELAAVTGLRSVTKHQVLKSGKRFATVSLRAQSWTNTDRYTVTKRDYRGKVYCVTMPNSTVIVRRRGRVSVTGQSQQELRALGHFEDGPLLAAYRANPRLDLHDHAQRLVNQMLNANFARKPIKNLAFGLLYGMGKDKTAASMEVDIETAQRIKRAYLSIFPGLDELIRDLKRRAAAGEPIRTWGGREYYVEQPKVVDGSLRTFEYRMLNVLIQGSSADCTKEAMVRYHYDHRRHGRFLAQVHDQILISVPEAYARAELRRLQDAMESVEFDVPMLTDGSIGPTWADLKDVVEKGREAA